MTHSSRPSKIASRLSALLVAVALSAASLITGTMPAQAITAGSIVTRAQSWVDAHVPYSMYKSYTNAYGTYRTDCSGFVSMAWGLGSSLSTVTLPSVSHVIGKEDLQPGDVLLNTAPGASGHVILFAGWADAGHTKYNGYESSPAYDGAHYTTNVPYPYWAGYGTFTPYRYNNYELPAADRDGDGIVDSADQCPDQPGPSSTQGCPDEDGDGVANTEDSCPRMPGLRALRGCTEEDFNPSASTGSDFDGDGRTDYCRRVGAPWPESRIECTVSTGTGFGATYQSDPVDWGFDTGRAWVGRTVARLSPPGQVPAPGQSPPTNPKAPGSQPTTKARPGKVSGLKVKRINTRHVRIAWKAPAGADSYRARIVKPSAKKTHWVKVERTRIVLKLLRRQHIIIAIRAQGAGGVGPVTRWRI